MSEQPLQIKWAKKVPQEWIRQLYENDARGLTDEALVSEVGWALYLRCEALVMVSRGQVQCPQCKAKFTCVRSAAQTGDERQKTKEKPPDADVTHLSFLSPQPFLKHGLAQSPRDNGQMVPCPECGWQASKVAYKASYNHGDLNGARAMAAFETYLDRYPKASAPRERVLLIDHLIHAFHTGLKTDLDGMDVPRRATANNLIVGSHANVVAFLSRLTDGANHSPEVQATRDEWEKNAERMKASRATPELSEEEWAALVNRLGGVDRQARDRALQILERDPAQAMPAILDGLRHENATVRAACAAFLDHHADARSVNGLVAALGDPASQVRVRAVHSLSCERCKSATLPVDAIPYLVDLALRDPNKRVRYEAIWGLYLQPRDARAVAALEAILRDETDVGLRKAASNALQRQSETYRQQMIADAKARSLEKAGTRSRNALNRS